MIRKLMIGLAIGAVAVGWVAYYSTSTPSAFAQVECGFKGNYYNLGSGHPDMGGPIPPGMGSVPMPGLVEPTLPIQLTPLGATFISQFDWWDPQYFVFNRIDPSLTFSPPDFFPVDTGLPGDPFHFAVHWHTTMLAPSSGSYFFQMGSDDSSWLFIDGNLILDIGGIHPFSVTSDSVTLAAGPHQVDIYFAERHTSRSAFSFEFTTELDCSPEPTPTPTDTPTPTPTLTPVSPTPIGGIGSFPSVAGDTPLEAPASSGGNASLLAGVIAGVSAVAITATGAAWYARRRWTR